MYLVPEGWFEFSLAEIPPRPNASGLNSFDMLLTKRPVYGSMPDALLWDGLSWIASNATANGTMSVDPVLCQCRISVMLVCSHSLGLLFFFTSGTLHLLLLLEFLAVFGSSLLELLFLHCATESY